MTSTLKILKKTWLLLGIVAVGHSHAAEYSKVDPNKSTLTFVYKQMGVPIEGAIKKFKTSLKFDPNQPTLAKASIEIEAASIDAGSQEANEALSDKDWFNVRTYPKVMFVSTGIKSLSNNRYEIAGKMTLKGRTQNMTTIFSVIPQGNTAIVDGAFTLRRADFSIGEGAWADFGTVANEVQVKFHFSTTAEK